MAAIFSWEAACYLDPWAMDYLELDTSEVAAATWSEPSFIRVATRLRIK